ncbi:hypothetical protein VTO73DRAFT_2724 [Trametes versicolor]
MVLDKVSVCMYVLPPTTPLIAFGRAVCTCAGPGSAVILPTHRTYARPHARTCLIPTAIFSTVVVSCFPHMQSLQ